MNFPENASFIWAEGQTSERNQFISFEMRFVLSTEAAGSACQLNLFADTRFRLWVNERFVAYGPARFVTQFPEYDSYDLRPFLQEGANLVRVEVNYYGCSSFQTMPDGKPGFIAWGDKNEAGIDFATPGDWRARVHSAWRADAPLFSFAQNPAEICDTRMLAEELADDSRLMSPRVLTEIEIPWKTLESRSVPYPKYAPVRPTTIELFAPLEELKTRGFQTFVAGFKRSPDRSVRRAFSTWMHSPQDQTIDLCCFWSDLRLNGEELHIDCETKLGNHGRARAHFKAGWNYLAGEMEILTEAWTYMFRIPDVCGISYHAVPDLDCKSRFALSPVSEQGVFAPEYSGDPSEYSMPENWTVDVGALPSLTPARVIAWDVVEEAKAVRGLPFKRLPEVASVRARQACWNFRFEKEYYGHPVIELEAPEGAILDVAYDDWLREDGCVNLYGANPFTDSADRFILMGGRQRIEVLNPRGGIFLQVTIRVPSGGKVSELKLHALEVPQRTTIESIQGCFESGDSTFDYAWNASVNTLVASSDDAYSDCPWRERGSYIGDALVGVNLERLVHTDLAVAKRTFYNFGLAALPSGQLACCAPSWLRKPHEDFTYLWIVGLHDIWSADGDVDFIKKNWSALKGIWDYKWTSHESGLYNTDGLRLFIDWGVDVRDREGEANAVINILRIAALRASAELAAQIDRPDEASAFRDEAMQVEKAIMDQLWVEAEGRFRSSLTHDTAALHANILALWQGIGPAERILEYLRPSLRQNLKAGLNDGQFGGHVELYFFYYLLPRLGEMGEVALAESIIADHYGFLQKLGCLTLNECFHRADKGIGSRCHTWSSAGAIYAHRYILGLRQASPANRNQWVLDPRTTDRFNQASGVLPLPQGDLAVRWTRSGGRIQATAKVPAGIQLIPGEGVDLTIETVRAAVFPNTSLV